MHDAWLSIVAGKYGKVIPLGVATIKHRQHTGNVVGALRKETMSEKIRNLMSVIEANRKRYAMTKGIIYHSVFDYMYYKIKDMRRRAKL
jgi:rhamnosyltransferase